MNRTIAARLRSTVETRPHAVAVEVDGEKYTYAQLEARASALLHSVSVLVGDFEGLRAGVVLRHSIEAYVALWACITSGLTFVPVNPRGSLQRNREVLQRASVSLLLVDDSSAWLARPLLADVPIVNAENASTMGPTVVPCRERVAIAYLLFTSGSTGTPKGVPITRSNLEVFADSIQDRYPLFPCDRVAQCFESTFDLAMYSTVVAWLAGATTVDMSDLDVVSPTSFVDRAEISVWFSVPSAISLASRSGQLSDRTMPSLRLSMFCGEALTFDLARRWKASASSSDIVNLYGPTEATIACSHYVISPGSEREGVVPIGKPLSSTKFALQDERGRIDTNPPPDASGELLIAGGQVFRGYWNDSQRTIEAFVAADDAHVPERWYRTGDLARLVDGEWEFIGRFDEQVQVLGHRVELREVEQRISIELEVPLSAVVVVPHTSADGIIEALTAFIETTATLPAGSIGRALPDYMVPGKVIVLDEFPLNDNGKVDRRELANVARSSAQRRL